jgi:16S rRNA (guanine966-N2)-methyltransferase
MRIISGKFKGRGLVSFKASHIRPTTDRVKETLFNLLMGQIEGARVLDLFSGTGNLGLEFISRGASWVDMVENHRQSLAIIRQNLQLLKVTEGYQLHSLDVFKFLARYEGEPYDIVMADPPFTRSWADSLGAEIAKSAVCGPQTRAIIEASSQEKVQTSYAGAKGAGLNLLDQRKFGDKYLFVFGR